MKVIEVRIVRSDDMLLPTLEEPRPNDAPKAIGIFPAEGSTLAEAQPDSTSVKQPEPRPDDASKTIEPSTVVGSAPARDSILVKQAVSGPRGGRPNKRDQIRSKVKALWKDPFFRAIPNRTDQAREVRARLFDENARHLDDMQGYRTTQIKRIIGEVANKPTET
jgi:hypothetical protein